MRAHRDVSSDGLQLGPQKLTQPRDRSHHIPQVTAHACCEVGALEQQGLGELPPSVPSASLDALASLPWRVALLSWPRDVGHVHGLSTVWLVNQAFGRQG